LRFARILQDIFMKEIKSRSNCLVSASLDVLGDKWTLLILRDMLFADKSTYGEFLQSAEKIATNILADRLAILESQGLISKAVAADKKSKFTYRLTNKGIDLLPVIMEFTIWGSKYNLAAGDPALLQELAEDKEGTILKYQQRALERNAG
jgi:DNA-binding HxlR family transcriptional regulator